MDGFTATERIHAISSPETAEKYGITADAEAWETRVLHYTLASIFNMNPGVSLYVGIFKPAAGANAFSEIKQIQNHAGGRLQQVGVWNGAVELSDTLVNSLQSVRTTLEAQNKPLSILYAPKVSDVTALPSDLAKIGRNGVSVIIRTGRRGSGRRTIPRRGQRRQSERVGTRRRARRGERKAKVHESIAWVESFPTNIAVARFRRRQETARSRRRSYKTLDNSRYIFLRTYDGLAGCFFNDNHTLDVPTSDYAFINDVRTMDKAVRGVRTYLLPKLGRPMKVDADTGKLERTAVEHLITTGNKALEGDGEGRGSRAATAST